MNISRKMKGWIICAYLGPLVFGLGGVATQVDAQNSGAPAGSRSVSITASMTQVADWVADEELRRRVQAALHLDKCLRDEQVTVSIENGVVVLRGIVVSDGDISDALRIARKAAGGRPVTDNLYIKGDRSEHNTRSP